MNSNLPMTGTAELLELLSPFVPDDFINHGWPTGATGARHRGAPADAPAAGRLDADTACLGTTGGGRAVVLMRHF